MFKILLFALMLCSTSVVLGQSFLLEGIIRDKGTGEVVPFVTVQEQGTGNGTLSDDLGHFLIQLQSETSSLVVSFIGMETQVIAVDGRSYINIELTTSSVELDELVVTALGVSREKKSLGYSSQSVKANDIQSGNSSNALNALSGRVAGLNIQGQNFGGSQNIMIRGGGSFTGNNQPLFVVDGVPVSNEGFNSKETQSGMGGYDYGSVISDLNPNDIEQVDVLKGSAASALYGARGQNGVIMISTKSGRFGEETFSIDVNSGVTFEKVSILPELQNSYGGGYSNAFETININGQSYEVVDFSADESWGPKFDKNHSPIHWWGMADYEQGLTLLPETSPWIAPENNVDTFYETGISYQNSVNMVKTSQSSSFRLGYSNVITTGVMPNSKQQKNTISMNATSVFFEDVVNLNTSVSLVHNAVHGRPYFGSGDSPTQVLFQWGQRQLDMNRLKNYENADGTQRAWNRVGVYDPTPRSSDNPYWSVYNNWQDDDRFRVYGTVGLSAQIIKKTLSADANVYFDHYTFNTRERVSIGSKEISSYAEAVRQANELNLEGKLNYRTQINDLDVVAVVGGNVRQNTFSEITGESNGGLVIDDLWSLSNSLNQSIVETYTSEQLVVSSFALISLGWNNFLYLDATYRLDSDSSLPSGGNTFSYFSVSGSALLSERIKCRSLDYLKMRMNYGETGNGTSPYQLYNTFKSEVPFNGDPNFNNNSQLNNEHLKPERTKEFEIGVEASVLNNRIGIDLSWYYRNTTHQIVPIEVSGSSGYTTRMVNGGLVNNSGVEIMLKGKPVTQGNFSWDVTLNFAKNRNKVKELPNNLQKIAIASAMYSGASLNAVIGESFQELYGYDYSYDHKGNRVINPENGFYEQGDFHSLGSVLPDFTAGIDNQLNYKRISVGALIDASKGGVYYSLSQAFAMYSGMHKATAAPTSNGNTIREDGVVVDGVLVIRDDNGGITSSRPNDINIDAHDYGNMHLHVFGTPSATTFYDASYIKLREVNLSYTVPFDNKHLKSIRCSVYGRNLATWGLDNPGLDPETIVGGNGNIQGIEAGVTPATRSYGMNVIVGIR